MERVKPTSLNADDARRAVIDTIPAFVWRGRPDGTMDFINRRWLDYTGFSLEKALGWGWQEAVHPDDLPALMDKWEKARAAEEADEIEARLRKHTGEYRWFLFRAEPVREINGKVLEWYGTSTDVESRKRAEQRANQAELELRTIVDTIPALAARYLPDGTPDFVNQTWRDYTGLTLDALEGKPGLIAVHPDDTRRVMEEWAVYLKTGEPFVTEQRIRRADGVHRWFLVYRKPQHDETGKIVNWYGVAHDIEDRKRAEAKIQQAEAELRRFVDTMPGWAWSSLSDGSADFISKGWLTYTNQSIEDTIGYGWSAALHPDDSASFVDRFRRAIATGEPYEDEVRIRRWDGQYRWFLVRGNPTRDELGNIVKWYGTCADIEDRKNAEDALRESEQRFRDFNEAASDWYWESGPDHRFTLAQHDRPLLASLAIPNRVGLFRWQAAADVEDEPAKWRAHLAMLDAHRPFRNFIYQVKMKDGSTKHISVSGIPRFDRKGRFLGYRGGGCDVTALVRAEQAQKTLEQARTELSHVTRLITLGELTTSIAHEVNQPLAGIVGNGAACLNWLDKDPPRPDEVRKSVEAMISDGNRAAAILTKIRALAKKTEPEKKVFGINDLLRESTSLLQRELSAHNVEMTEEFSPNLPHIFGDPVQIQQVVINLILNAIDSMQAVDNRRREILIRSSSIDDEQIIVEVQDSGIGIHPTAAERIFEAFFTTKHHGLGMGLSISRSIIEAHHGSLSSQNTTHGAIFRFSLPSHKAAIEIADQ